MAWTQAEQAQFDALKSQVDNLDKTVSDVETKFDVQVSSLFDRPTFVGYVTTKYIGDGMSKEWQVRPALLIAEDTCIVLAPDDEGGVYTARGVVKNNKAHIPNTWHDAEG